MTKNDCSTCTQKSSVYNADPVPFVVHENMRAQHSVENLRLLRIIVFLIIVIVSENLYLALIK